VPELAFTRTHNYGHAGSGIELPVVLGSGAKTVRLVACLDTGASNCLFERLYGELLTLDIEAGQPKTFRTATGRVETFGHLVTLSVLELQCESFVYFFADEHINKNLLGRIGWLDRIRLGLVDYDSALYLAPYDFR
jgi:hypothetical protein